MSGIELRLVMAYFAALTKIFRAADFIIVVF